MESGNRPCASDAVIHRPWSSHSAIRPHRGRAWRSVPADLSAVASTVLRFAIPSRRRRNPAHGLTLVSREPLKGYDRSSREIPVVTFFGLTGCWHALDSAVAERPGPTTPSFSTVRRRDHVKTTPVYKVILETLTDAGASSW